MYLFSINNVVLVNRLAVLGDRGRTNVFIPLEEGRRETQEEFYYVLEEHGKERKKHVFEELDDRVADWQKYFGSTV